MEWLNTPSYHKQSLSVQENFLEGLVWNKKYDWVHVKEEEWQEALSTTIGIKVPPWALDEIAVIHGDPTLDNLLITRKGHIRITDPVPPNWLKKPSIIAVDHGKILQSFLGWETVLRGVPFQQYDFPRFMHQESSAKRAVFWCMVALKRLVFRGYNPNVTLWAKEIGRELEKCV